MCFGDWACCGEARPRRLLASNAEGFTHLATIPMHMATFGDLSSNKGLPPAFPPVDHVFPIVPVRQWVLSIPFALRYRLAYDSGLLIDVLNVFIRSRLWLTSP